MKKLLSIYFAGIILFSSSVAASPKQLVCVYPDENAKTDYMERLLNDAKNYRSQKSSNEYGKYAYCSGDKCEEYARDNEAIVEACKLVDHAARYTFVFDTDGLKGSEESGAEMKEEQTCLTKIEEVKAKMTHTPSIITFKVWSDMSEKYNYYNVDRKTLKGGFSYAKEYMHQCKLEDVDMSENIL